MIIPKHLFEDYKGGKSRDAPTNLDAGRHRALHVRRFQAGRSRPRQAQPELPRAQPALFRRDRDEGRRRCRVGGARRFADRRIRFRLEPAGGGRNPEAARGRRQGPGRHHPQLVPSSTSSSTTPIRGPPSTASGRASRRSTRSLPIPQCGRRSTCWSTGCRCSNTSTAGLVSLPPTSSTIQSGSARPDTHYEFNVAARRSISSTRPAGSPAPTASGKRTASSSRSSIRPRSTQPRQKNQEIVKQACQKAGIAVELKAILASVFFSSDVGNPDTYSKFYTDIQMYTINMNQPDPQQFMRRIRLLGGRAEGQQMAGPQHPALAKCRIRCALPCRRAASSIRSSGRRCSSR